MIDRKTSASELSKCIYHFSVLPSKMRHSVQYFSLRKNDMFTILFQTVDKFWFFLLHRLTRKPVKIRLSSEWILQNDPGRRNVVKNPFHLLPIVRLNIPSIRVSNYQYSVMNSLSTGFFEF